MTKTSRTHCVRPVKTYYTQKKVVCIWVLTKKTMKHNRNEEIHAKEHKASLLSANRTEAFFYFTTNEEDAFIAFFSF